MLRYSTSNARKHLGEIVNKVRFEHIIVSIGRHDKDEVLIVPKPEFAEDVPVTHMNAQSPSFQFLRGEPDIYSIGDLKKRYV